MIEEKVSKLLEQCEISWNLDNGKTINPTSDDVRRTLDKATAMLYDGKQGDSVMIAGMLIYKTESGYEVFVSAGEIKEK